MSTQPQPFPASPQMQKEEKERKAARAARRSDAMYLGGAALVTAGAAMFQIRLGLIVAGAFVLMEPVIQIVVSFIRGVRTPSRGR
jgi:hypothetical protein